jgi:hypothetical protein
MAEARRVTVEELASKHHGITHHVRNRLQEQGVEVGADDTVEESKAAKALKGWKLPVKKS